MAAGSPFTSSEREAIWGRVHLDLLQHAGAVPDSRFHYDFSSFVPDFRGSSSAIDRIVQLPCYISANTILVTPDNSLEQLRYRALKDGKKLLVATYKLSRGFVLLDPKRISEDQFEMASLLDTMERPGIGRSLTLAQMEEKVDLCVTGVLAVTEQGVIIRESPNYFEIQWRILLDRKVLEKETPVIAVAHSCQVIGWAEELLKKSPSDGQLHIIPNFIVTPERVTTSSGVGELSANIDFDALDPKLFATIPVLQELRGIQMMEEIMKGAGFPQEPLKPTPTMPDADEQLGISIVEKLMRGYKV
jgi:5-formyltetrahydrofolate cyclo-ligase